MKWELWVVAYLMMWTMTSRRRVMMMMMMPMPPTIDMDAREEMFQLVYRFGKDARRDEETGVEWKTVRCYCFHYWSCW